MKAVWEALYTKFNADTNFKTAVGGQFYPGFADQERATCPYAIYLQVTDLSDWTFSEDIETITMQISVCDDQNSPTRIKTIEGYLYALFDDAILSVSGYDFVRMHRQMTQGPYRDDAYGTWQFNVDYEIEIRK